MGGCVSLLGRSGRSGRSAPASSGTQNNNNNNNSNSLAPVAVYNEEEFGGDSECVICQCEYVSNDKVRTLPCKHTFHKDCIETWLQTGNTCPVCREDMSRLSICDGVNHLHNEDERLLMPFEMELVDVDASELLFGLIGAMREIARRAEEVERLRAAGEAGETPEESGGETGENGTTQTTMNITQAK